MRGSSKDRAEFYAKALGAGGGRGWMTQNDIRRKENLNPLPGGDELPQALGGQIKTTEGNKPDEIDEETDSSAED